MPNSIFTRDSSSWIFNGVSLNPMFFEARQLEVVHVAAIYNWHPMFADADFEFWYPDQDEQGRFVQEDWGRASLEGGDVMPIGNKHACWSASASAPPRRWWSGWRSRSSATVPSTA